MEFNNARSTHGPGKKTWAFAGGKGGSGKTVIAANLAVLLAQKGKHVILLDCSLGHSSSHTILGLPEIPHTLTDFIFGDVKNLTSVLVETGIENLQLVSGAYDDLSCANLNFATKSKLLRHVEDLQCDYLIMDVGSGTGYNALDLFSMADTGVLVSTAEPSSVELIYRFLKAHLRRRMKAFAGKPLFETFIDEELRPTRRGNLIEMAGRALEKIAKVDMEAAIVVERELYNFRLGLIVNMCQDKRDQYLGPGICDVAGKFYGSCMKYSGHIPYDLRIPHSERMRKPFVIEHGSTETSACMTLALDALMGHEKDMDRVKNNVRVPKNVIDFNHNEILSIKQDSLEDEIEEALMSQVSIYSKSSTTSYMAINDNERRWMIDAIQGASDELLSQVRGRKVTQATGLSHQATTHKSPNPPGRQKTVVNSMASVGEMVSFQTREITGANLKNIRVAKGVTLEEISDITKVRKSFLEAIEAEDSENFPAPVFLIGYLKAYAKALGLNPGEISRKYIPEKRQ